jgi:flagellar protein FliT
MTHQHEMIEQAWTLTQAIEEAAAASDWPRAAELSEVRSPLLMGLQAEQPAEALGMIREIQASMAAVTEAARIAQEGLATGYRRALDGANAASRYQAAARL